MKTQEIIDALKSYYSTGRINGQLIYISELRGGTGFENIWNKQGIDFWVFYMWQSHHYSRYSYEIKVSRADFLKELKEPKKRRMALAYSNYYYFITPPGLVKPEELPLEAGLKEVHPPLTELRDYRIKTVHEAPRREPITPNWSFMAQLMRQCVKQGVIKEGASS